MITHLDQSLVILLRFLVCITAVSSAGSDSYVGNKIISLACKKKKGGGLWFLPKFKNSPLQEEKGTILSL